MGGISAGKRFLTWEEFDAAVDNLAAHVYRLIRGAGVWVIREQPRGGKALALALSHRLGLAFEDGTRHHRAVVWVDDVIDSGKTFSQARETHCRMTPAPMVSAVWVLKNRLYRECCCWALEAPPSEWIVFPWELPDRVAEDRAAYERRVGVTK